MEFLLTKFYSLLGAWTLLQTFLPPALRDRLERAVAKMWEKLFQTAHPHAEVELEVEEGYNAFYTQIGVYLSSLRSCIQTQTRLKVCTSIENGGLSFNLQDNEALEDSFKGARVSWTHSCRKSEGANDRRERSFTLRFSKADRDMIMPAYLDHIITIAKEIEHRNTQRYLYRNCYDNWEDIPFNHPATFETLALDEGMADRIKADLDAFCNGKSFYHRNGRVWKRGYLLYGPPGTGKSSMIAAIANHLQFDIYDLELTKVADNAELKSLLIHTSPKSVIVIEDVDCSACFSSPDDSDSTSCNESESGVNQSCNDSKLTLSGLLNFADGLWSCCGEERIFIFTTNYKDRLDPALLRPGRMDMHILLSYCSFTAFKKLASNYLGIQDHPLYPKLEVAMKKEQHEITPAAVAELLISHQDDPDAALRQMIASVQSSPLPQVDQVDTLDIDDQKLLPVSGKEIVHKRRFRRPVLFFLTAIRGKHVD